MQAAGARNVRIEIQELDPDATPDDSGRVDETNNDNWREYFSCWAKVMHRGGREFLEARQVNADLTELLQVLASTKTKAIEPTMRIRMKGRTLGILSSYNVGEMNETVEIQCKEAV